jgi:hypothetical protein
MGEKLCKKSGVFEWHKWFIEGHENVEDAERSHSRSHRTNENVEKVWNLVHLRRCVSINQAYYMSILKQ